METKIEMMEMEMEMEMEMWKMEPCSHNKNNKMMKLNLMDLPSEILVNIFKRLPTKAVCYIRCVSKTLLGIVDAPSFVTLHTRLLIRADSPHDHVKQAYSPPQLILRTHRGYCGKTDEEIMTMQLLNYNHANAAVQGCQLDDSQILQTSTPYFPYAVHFVFCNLICLRHRCNDSPGFIIDPLRGQVLRLPQTHNSVKQVNGNTKFIVDSDVTGMGFDSITNTYKILRVSLVSGSCTEAHVLVLGTSEWRRIPTSAPPPPAKFMHFAKNVCAFGDMHWLVHGYRRQGIEGRTHILSFDFKKEDFFWIPNPYKLPNAAFHLHFISFRGSMALVDTSSRKSIEIWVMKDYNDKQWTHDYSIDIHMLEWDPRFDFIGAVCGEWEHGILISDESAMTTYFLDLRPPVVTKIHYSSIDKRQQWQSNCRRILSPSGSLISLKSYANLIGGEEELAATYRNWSEGVASGDNFFYLTR